MRYQKGKNKYDKEYHNKISTVADIINGLEEGTIIPYENVTVDLMDYILPIKGTKEWERYTRSRSKIKVDINKCFVQKKYRCILKTHFNVGYEVLRNENADFESYEYGQNKNLQSLERQMKEALQQRESYGINSYNTAKINYVLQTLLVMERETMSIKNVTHRKILIKTIEEKRHIISKRLIK